MGYSFDARARSFRDEPDEDSLSDAARELDFWPEDEYRCRECEVLLRRGRICGDCRVERDEEI